MGFIKLTGRFDNAVIYLKVDTILSIENLKQGANVRVNDTVHTANKIPENLTWFVKETADYIYNKIKRSLK